MAKFEFTKTMSPDLAGSFHVKYGREFDEELYEQACGIKPPKEVCKQIQRAVDDLQEGEWLQIRHVGE
jgi:hypothetical protein